MAAPPNPPRLFAALLRRALPAGVRRESIMGDLYEEFAERCDRPRHARRWYRRQALRLIVHYLLHSRASHPAVPNLRRRRGDPMFFTLLRDLRLALRAFRRSPAFAAVAVLTVALGVGANTAIFSVVNGIVLRPLPYPDADRIVRPWEEKIFSRRMFQEFREQTRSFENLAIYQGNGLSLVSEDESERLAGGLVTAGYFDVMGVRPRLGRGFTEEDENSAAEQIVILSHGLWQRAFGGNPAIVGRRIPLEGDGATTRTVVGVLPPDYEPLFSDWQFWTPLPLNEDAPNFGSYGFRAIARLRPGVTIEQSRADVGRLVEPFQENHPTQFRPIRRSPIPVLSLHEAIVGGVQETLWLVLGAVGFVLLIACVNVANLLLARAGSREKEMAVRLALGAGRGRLVRQMLTESTVLAVAGGILGVAVAAGTIQLVAADLPANLPRTGAIRIDVPVLLFGFLISVVSGVGFGMVPAFRATDTGAARSLREGGRGGTQARGRLRLNQTLVVAEVALAMVLVTGAGLLVKSFARLQRVDAGFLSERLLTIRPLPPQSRYPEDEHRSRYLDDVLARLRATPGVEGASTISLLPMTGANSGIPYLVEGEPVPTDQVSQVINYRVIHSDYFRVMGIPLINGREFSDADHADAPEVGIVNQTTVDLHWPGENPLGKRLQQSDGSEWLTVVGVVGDIQQHQLDLAPRPQVYVPWAQGFQGSPRIVVRTAGDPGQMLATVRETVRQIDPHVPIIQMATMNEVIAESLGEPRFFTSLFAGFAGLALLLGGVGVYGVLAYVTSQRMRELGVRVALGATPSDVLRNTLGRGMLPVAIGIGTGLVAALGLTRLLAGMLFNVPSADPTVLVTVAGLLVVAGVAAAYLPAYRASRVDPVEVLAEQ